MKAYKNLILIFDTNLGSTELKFGLSFWTKISKNGHSDKATTITKTMSFKVILDLTFMLTLAKLVFVPPPY